MWLIFNIQLKKLIAFFSISRGPNVKFENDDVINRINCICHLINNLVCYMCAVEPVKKIIENVSGLVSYVRNSGLGEKCEPKLKKYTESRWNTVYYTMDSVESNYSRLAHVLLEKEQADKNADVMHKLTNISRSDLSVISKFLKKFKTWSEQLEADKVPTLWMVWPTFESLKKYLAPNDTDEEIILQMKEAGRSYLEDNIYDFTPKTVHKIATVLHPLLRNIALASGDERKEVYGIIDDFIWRSEPFHEAVAESQSKEAEDSENQDILEAFMGIPIVEKTQKSDYTEELQKYLQMKLPLSSPYEFNLCKWWHMSRQTFPNLFRLFLSNASITASSAPSERKFSETGIIITARRSNILPETVANLVLARNNLMEFL